MDKSYFSNQIVIAFVILAVINAIFRSRRFFQGKGFGGILDRQFGPQIQALVKNALPANEEIKFFRRNYMI